MSRKKTKVWYESLTQNDRMELQFKCPIKSETPDRELKFYKWLTEAYQKEIKNHLK